MRQVLFYLLIVGFFTFGIFGVDATWNKWHLHQSVAGDFESSAYWILMSICGFGLLALSRNMRSRRNRYVCWRD